MGICSCYFEWISYIGELDIFIVSLIFLPQKNNYEEIKLCEIFKENDNCIKDLVEESQTLFENLQNINTGILILLIFIIVFFIMNFTLKCIRVKEKYFFLLIISKLIFVITEWSLSLAIHFKINKFINDNKNYIQEYYEVTHIFIEIKDENLKRIKEGILTFFILSSCYFFISILQIYLLCNSKGDRCYKCECNDNCSFCYCSLRREIEDIIDINCQCRNCCCCCYILYLCFCFCKKSNNYSPSLRISQFTNNIDVIPQEIKDLIEAFEDKLKDLMNNINKDEKEIREKFEKLLKERGSKLKPQAKKLNEEVEKLKKKIMKLYQK